MCKETCGTRASKSFCKSTATKQRRVSVCIGKRFTVSRNSTCFQLPVIILSAIAGSATLLSKGYPYAEEYILNGTAGISILVSIISAVASYLKLGETKSKHEYAEVSWQNFYNGIKHQLGLARSLRSEPEEYISEVKTNYDRLFEISPICNQALLSKVKKHLSKHATPEFKIPNYMNGWEHTNV